MCTSKLQTGDFHRYAPTTLADTDAVVPLFFDFTICWAREMVECTAKVSLYVDSKPARTTVASYGQGLSGGDNGS